MRHAPTSNVDNASSCNAAPLQYRPPRWLRNRHIQSVLGMSARRRRLGLREIARTGAITTEHFVDGGNGIALHGLHSAMPGAVSDKGLVILLHGWEGSAQSSYMLMTTARLLAAGFDVFRLHFRDHGGTHHLNREIFHPELVGEVAHAVGDVAHRFPHSALMLAGFSLGGNFALRIALQAADQGATIRHVATVCPALNVSNAVKSLEREGLYHWWFRRRWAASLVRKRELFPDHLDIDDRTLHKGVRAIVHWLVRRYTDLPTIEHYFERNRISPDHLAALPVSASILMSSDDPMVPVHDFLQLRLPPTVTLDLTSWGGHCGFVENARLDGFAERWITQQLLRAAGESGASRMESVGRA